MFSSFEGQIRSRPTINLGGSSSSSSSLSSLPARNADDGNGHSSSIAQRARQERQARENQRKLDRAARVIQAFYRSRIGAGQTRDAVRTRLDELLALSSDESPDWDIMTAALLSFSFRDANKSDSARLASWARAAASGKPVIRLFAAYARLAYHPQEQRRYSLLLRRISHILLEQAAAHPTQASVPLYLELVKQLLDPSKYKDVVSPQDSQVIPAQLAESLVRNGAFSQLRRHLLSLPRSTKPLPISLGPVIAIALSLIARTSSSHDSLDGFISNILTIPALVSPGHLPGTAYKALTVPTSTLPYYDILSRISDSSLLDDLDQIQTAYLLANLIALGETRFITPLTQSSAQPNPGIKNAKELLSVLTGFKSCLERLSGNLLNSASAKGKSREMAIVVDDIPAQETGDVVMADGSEPVKKKTDLDAFTLSKLQVLASESLLAALVSLSTRYSATTRPALSAFLVTLLYAWPERRESVVNALVYSTLGGVARGLLREIWRGWVRTSGLARAIASADSKTGSGATSSILSTLTDAKHAQDWPHFILLAELYARCLMTLGDDEFFAPSTGQQDAMARNPLTTDEVVGFSALWRNVAFALYWQPEALRDPSSGKERTLPGTRIPLEAIRKLGTSLLQAIHSRDSRRPFTPKGHWIMTSALDLQSFIESTLLEDQAIDDERPTSTGANTHDDDSDDELPRLQSTVKRNLPSRRQMAYLSPRLGVLNNIPFVIPFETRASIFQQFIANDRARLGLSGRHFGWAGKATIRRGHVADDGFSQLSSLGAKLKGRLYIRFLDEYGQEEAGIDGGGLFKEFLTDLTKEAFDVDRGLWLETTEHELYPAATSYAKEPHSLQWYAFLGRVLGKALYEGILVDVPFAPFFLSKWLGRASGFDDLASYDPQLYAGLVQLKNYVGNVEKDLALNFTVIDDDFGASRTIDLIPNGSNVPVTNENRIAYIYRVSDYRLNKQIAAQCAAFFSGLSDLVDPKWLRMFNQVELGLLVGGTETNIDVDDLRHNTVYNRGYDESHPTIQYFWKVVGELTQQEKKALVKFATSCPRPPLLGFSQLNPKFAINNGGDDESRLPSASTCVNLLKLPTYSSPGLLKEKLRASINSGAGFDLS